MHRFGVKPGGIYTNYQDLNVYSNAEASKNQ